MLAEPNGRDRGPGAASVGTEIAPGAAPVDIGDLSLPATIVRRDVEDFAIRFDAVGAARADLIRLIYSGRYSASVLRIEPARVAAAIIGRAMR